MKKRYLFMCLSVMILTVLMLASCGECSTLHTEHEFNERVASEEYFAQEATCSGGPRYYYSCKCGAKHSEWSFESGMRNPTAHHIVNGVCTLCNLPESTPVEGLIFSLTPEGDGYILTDAKKCTATEITVGLYNGLPVRRIAKKAFSTNQTVQKITVADSVRYIEENAFSDCPSLLEVILFAQTDEIPKYCFAASHNLKRITLPTQLRVIGDGAFAACASLEELDIPDTVYYIGINVFSGCYKLLPEAAENGVFYIDTWAYSLVSGTTEVALRQGTTGILPNAFAYSSLTKVTLPDGLHAICDAAFQNCTELAECALPDTVTYIGERAFEGCSSLTALTLPEHLYTLGKYAFADCSGIEEVTVPGHMSKISEGVFTGCSSLKRVILQEGIHTVEPFAFQNCTVLEGVELPTSDFSVESIGEKAFAGCHALTDINLPNTSHLYIGPSAFEGCDGVIEKEGGVLYVGNHAIGYEDGVTSVILREGTVSIAEGAFAECTTLTDIQIPTTVLFLYDIFPGCTSLKTLVLPKWEYLSEIIFTGSVKPSAIYYLGTAENWRLAEAELERLGGFALFQNVSVYIYSETEPTEAGSYWHFDADGKPTPW